MSEIDLRWSARLNQDEFDKDIAEVKKKGENINRSLITGIRRTAQVGIAMTTLFGGSIDQSYALGIEAALIGIETIVEIQAALATATLGASAPALLLQAGAVVTLGIQIGQLESGQAAAAAQFGGLVQALRLLSF